MPDLAFLQFAGAALMPVAAGASQPGRFRATRYRFRKACFMDLAMLRFSL